MKFFLKKWNSLMAKIDTNFLHFEWKQLLISYLNILKLSK